MSIKAATTSWLINPLPLKFLVQSSSLPLFSAVCSNAKLKQNPITISGKEEGDDDEEGGGGGGGGGYVFKT